MFTRCGEIRESAAPSPKRCASRARVFWWPAIVSLALWGIASCQAAPLLNTPYRTIQEEHRQKSLYLVRVAGKGEVSFFRHSSSPDKPTPQQVRQAICDGFANIKFRCVAVGDPAVIADYMVRFGFDLVTEGFQPMRRGPLPQRIKTFEKDEPADGDPKFEWWFEVYNQGEARPFFKSSTFRDEAREWRKNVRTSITRHFSE